MYWTPADDQRSNNSVILSRFGHTATVVDTTDSWDGPVVVVHGGVGIPGVEAAPAVQTALSDVIVLHLQRSLWTAPEVIGPATPGPRAFHCAAAVGRYIYVFGGHILVYENRDKKRTFFNDLWQLDTVRPQVAGGKPQGVGARGRLLGLLVLHASLAWYHKQQQPHSLATITALQACRRI